MMHKMNVAGGKSHDVFIIKVSANFYDDERWVRDDGAVAYAYGCKSTVKRDCKYFVGTHLFTTLLVKNGEH